MALPQVDERPPNSVLDIYDLAVRPEPTTVPEKEPLARIGAHIVYTGGVKVGPFTQIYEVKGVLTVPEAPQDHNNYDINSPLNAFPKK